jgi:hypothetical protein
MNNPWQSLEEVGDSATLAEWKQLVGTAFDGFNAAFLTKTSVHDILSFDRSRLGRAIAWAFGCDPIELRIVMVPTAIQVASLPNTTVQIYLTIPQSRDEFRKTVIALAADSHEPFILFAPTSRFMDSRSQELLDSCNAVFIDLASNVDITADGNLVARKPAHELFARFLPDNSGRLNVPDHAAGNTPKVPLETMVQPTPGAKENIQIIGRFKYRDGFEDVWLGDEHYDLRGRKKICLCLEYLVENKAFASASARHFVNEIDVYVREKGSYPKSADIKIDHYFNDQDGRLRKLRMDLILASGRNGRFFLKTD